MTEGFERAKRTQLLLGAGVVVLSILLFGGLLAFALRGTVPGTGVVADAIIYVDVPGRIAVDKTLQADGPAPIPVSAGTHTVTFLDVSPNVPPLEIEIASGQFYYVYDPAQGRRSYVAPGRGVIYAPVFPPDATVEVPDCTPTDALRPVRCRAQHALTAEVSPGTYAVRFTHPLYSQHEERVAASAGSISRVPHSFIATVSAWEKWRKDYGEVLERSGYRPQRRYGAGDALLLPFEAVGAVFGELLD